MNNRELIEYLKEFEDNAEVSVIVANPEARKVYQPEEMMVMSDDELTRPCMILKVGNGRNMDEEESKLAKECEKDAQPELPRLKNNDQRKEFLKTYRDWPVWFEVPQADEVYYRYILQDDSAIVICEYKQHCEWWTNKYINKDPEGTFTKEYLLESGYHHLHDCETNQTALIRKLMEVQKK